MIFPQALHQQKSKIIHSMDHLTLQESFHGRDQKQICFKSLEFRNFQMRKIECR